MNGLGNPLEHKNEESSTFAVVQLLNHIQLFAAPWTAAYQAPLSMGFAKAFHCVDHNKLENSSRVGNTRTPYLPPEKSV